ncbi:MAG: nuclear transport factor 2 family protein [Microbacteriaceae bacterium]|nr:nuclear transport factor 2 family protein [Cryobacterium sp.]MBX3103980.1 nuclear transport factor 2 family protein [Cryobacterium sp.]MCC6376319.1 nuclear transport factor 2 family protein [Microbacteriaceae bacterium]
MSTDQEVVTELHKQFVEANTHEDTDWLGAHIVADITWFNLNKSNYFGNDAILNLWTWLGEQRPDKSKEAVLTVSNRHVQSNEGAVVVSYDLSVDYDFGDAAQFHAGARGTEVWFKLDGEFKLVHFHCSEHEPGNMGGL